MSGYELDLLTDLTKIQNKMRVKYPSLKLYARGPWLLEKIITSDAATVEKSIDIVFDCVIKDKFKKAELQDEISKLDDYGFQLKIIDKKDVTDVDFAIDKMWYDIEDGQLLESEQNWKTLQNIREKEPLTNVDYRWHSNKSDV